jgi:hypothetical protein
MTADRAIGDRFDHGQRPVGPALDAAALAAQVGEGLEDVVGRIPDDAHADEREHEGAEGLVQQRHQDAAGVRQPPAAKAQGDAPREHADEDVDQPLGQVAKPDEPADPGSRLRCDARH